MNALLQRIGEQQAAGAILVLARVGPLFVFAPLFSSRLIPVRVRGVVAVALAVVLVPAALQGQSIATDPVSLTGLVAKEMLVGLAFAFAVGALFTAVSVAGALLDVLVGLSYGAVVDPLTGAQSSALTQLYGFTGLLVFVAIGGDAWVLQGLARTYDLVPLASVPDLGTLTAGVVRAFTTIFVSAVQLAAPVILALVITDSAFGLVSRVVPQLNVFAVSFPAKIALGLLIVGVSLPFVGGWLADALQRSVTDALSLLRVA